MPSVAGPADKDSVFKRWGAERRLINVIGDVIARCCDNRRYAGRINPVFIIMRQKLRRRRNCNRAELVKPENGEPVLIMSFKDKQDPVTFFYTDRTEIVGTPVAFALKVFESNSLFLFVLMAVGLCVSLYSYGYMKDDREFNKYYCYLNFFIFSMTALLISSNLTVIITPP